MSLSMFTRKATSPAEAFREIDKNGDGCLSVDELVKALSKAGGKEWPRARIVHIVGMLDKDKDPKLDVSEFKAVLSYLERGHAVQDEMMQAYRTIEALQQELGRGTQPTQPSAASAPSHDDRSGAAPASRLGLRGLQMAPQRTRSAHVHRV